MQDVEVKLGGCPGEDKCCLSLGVTPIIVEGRDTTKTFTRCPVCGGELRFGSRDPCEGDWYWCIACGDGPISFPLYGGPKPVKKVAAVINADKVQEQALIERLLVQGRRYQITGNARSFR
jgi:hypothetical protein